MTKYNFYDIFVATIEYLLYTGEKSNRIIPSIAFSSRWKSISRNSEQFNSALDEYHLEIVESGVLLKNEFCIQTETRRYLRRIIEKVFEPSVVLISPAEKYRNKYPYLTTYTEQERTDLDHFSEQLSEIFAKKETPKTNNFLLPQSLKLCYGCIFENYSALKKILYNIWHSMLKTGDDITGYFPQIDKPEFIREIRAIGLFELKNKKIVLTKFSKTDFLFLLAGLTARNINNPHYAWVLFVGSYFHAENERLLKKGEA